MNRTSFLLLAAMLTSSLGMATPPLDKNLNERVSVELRSFTVTANPKNGDLAQCQKLGVSSFEAFLLDGSPIQVVSVDRDGVQSLPSADISTPLERPAIYSIILFNRLSLQYHELSEQAFNDVVRSLTSGAFKARFNPNGDKIRLASFDGRTISNDTEWTGDLEAFVAAVKTLRNKPLIEIPGVDGRHNLPALEEWANSLADDAVAGKATKNVYLLSGDFQMDTNPKLASEFERARVSINSVDLGSMNRTRILPQGLGTLAWLTSGEVFSGNAAMGNAVEKVVGNYENGCRVIVYLRASPDAKLTLRLRDKDFRVSALPPTQELPPITNDERFGYLLARQFFHDGLRIDSTVLPIKPIGRDQWRAVIIARVRVQEGEGFPDVSKGLDVYASLNDRRDPQRLHLNTKDVEDLRKQGSRLLIFETTVAPGRRSSLVAVTTPDASAGAVSRTSFTVSKPPKEGESTTWSLVGTTGRIEGATILLPALDSQAPPGKPPIFMGYGCGKIPQTGSVITEATGQLVTSVPLSLRSTMSGCGWFLGSPKETLPHGKYVFKPPQSRGAAEVRFTVAAASREAARLPSNGVEASSR